MLLKRSSSSPPRRYRSGSAIRRSRGYCRAARPVRRHRASGRQSQRHSLRRHRCQPLDPSRQCRHDLQVSHCHRSASQRLALAMAATRSASAKSTPSWAAPARSHGEQDAMRWRRVLGRADRRAGRRHQLEYRRLWRRGGHRPWRDDPSLAIRRRRRRRCTMSASAWPGRWRRRRAHPVVRWNSCRFERRSRPPDAQHCRTHAGRAQVRTFWTTLSPSAPATKASRGGAFAGSTWRSQWKRGRACIPRTARNWATALGWNRHEDRARPWAKRHGR